MRQIKPFLFFLLCTSSFTIYAFAQNNDMNKYALMTTRDVKDNLLSNITITNRTGQLITASGVFMASADVNDCSSCFGGIFSGDNTGGAVVTPVRFKPNESVSVGQSFLYNMLYNGLYFISTVIGAPCQLPGCSWPGDSPAVQGWCITINVMSIDSNYTYCEYTNGSNPPANVPAYGQAGNSTPFNYKYDLIDPNTLAVGNACLGPIICDDKTLTCKVNTRQDQSFQPYT